MRSPQHDSAAIGASLVARLSSAISGFVRTRAIASLRAARPRTAREWIGGALVALLVATIPLTIDLGARIAATRAQSRAHLLQRSHGRAIADRASLDAQRERLRALSGSPRLAYLVDRIAAVLPAGATIASVERGETGDFTLRITSVDPDRLRSALHREPLVAGLRDAEQRQVNGGMLVTLTGTLR